MNLPHWVNPWAPIQVGIQHRQLIQQLAWRRIESRYRGSVLGILWAFVDPILILAVYTFVFCVVFKAKWSGAVVTGNNAEFALFLFSGVMIYNIFSQCIAEAPTDMIRNRLFVTDMIFPIEVLTWASLLVALFNFTLSCLILVGFYFFVYGLPPSSILWLPLILSPLLFATLGLSWFLSSLGVYIRDVAQVTGVFITMFLFMSPIFYSAASVPEELRPVYDLNPLVAILEMSKGALFHGQAPIAPVLILSILGSWLIMWAGFAWFETTKKGFADVL